MGLKELPLAPLGICGVKKLKNLFAEHPEILNLRMFFYTFTSLLRA